MSTRQTVVINGPDDRQRIATWARNVEPGTVVTFRKKSRSTEQNAKLHAMLGEVAKQVEWHGQFLDPDDWKDMFTASLRHARVVPGIDRGTYVPLGMHTSTLTIEEMSNLIELIYAFGAEHGVVFKDPKEPDQPDSGENSPSPPEAGDPAPMSPAEEVGDPPLTSSTLSDSEWLKTAARMLWAAAHVTGDTDSDLQLLNNQRLAVADLCPTDTPQATKDKAGSIYRQCKARVTQEIDRETLRKFVAGIAGMEEKELSDG
ncbi:recombination protein NinB [Neorhizobium sp. LjRoot104]|uniref:recombination protein NinB n=1 Tax=Neorhizobium sp. LjRoot104 TaxID=3342254 RepID=UPI003ED15CC5